MMSDVHFPVVHDGPQMVQRIECASCGATGKNVLNRSRAGDEQLAVHFRRHGWDVDLKRRRNLCPECIAKETERTRRAKDEKKMEKLSVVSPSPNSALAKKIMSDLLFEHYDLTAHDYKPGWDDARVAKESGLSEQFVSQRRDQDYGPCSPPRKAVFVEVSAIAAEITARADAIGKAFEVIGKDFEALKAEADKIKAIASDQQKKASAA